MSDNLRREEQLIEQLAIADMFKPVRCTCGGIYDLGTVEVTGRYTDCSVWRAPCCGRTADDRGETGWKSTQDYTVLGKANPGGFRTDGERWWP
ncbi:hypothetical protein [Actinoplanes rectilineatus]|uniref:hypothetical protein n=1 Tax=Actinoplanes rectilineatus TaxID=113571 RepID=UPI0005F2850F|nr:hypothetical protein [Actinoplanes rectilineatus]